MRCVLDREIRKLRERIGFKAARIFISEVFDIGPDTGWCQPQPSPLEIKMEEQPKDLAKLHPQRSLSRKFVKFVSKVFADGHRLIFLHYARKTFNPWAWIQNGFIVTLQPWSTRTL